MSVCNICILYGMYSQQNADWEAESQYVIVDLRLDLEDTILCDKPEIKAPIIAPKGSLNDLQKMNVKWARNIPYSCSKARKARDFIIASIFWLGHKIAYHIHSMKNRLEASTAELGSHQPQIYFTLTASCFNLLPACFHSCSIRP